MIEVEHDARILGLLLGLGDLNPSPTCLGYRAGCVCPGCQVRSDRVTPEFLAWLELDDESDPPPLFVQPRQPWEAKAA